MSSKVVRTTIVLVAVVLGGLLAVAVGFYLYVSDPMDDMRQSADRLPLPRDFVLMSESYSSGGFFGAIPHLERVYSASWPGACESLQTLGRHHGGPNGLARVPRQYAEDMCNIGASCGSGWRGWIRGYPHYELRLTACRPGFGQGPGWEYPHGFYVLYPAPDSTGLPKIVIPDGHARVAVELIAHRGW